MVSFFYRVSLYAENFSIPFPFFFFWLLLIIKYVPKWQKLIKKLSIELARYVTWLDYRRNCKNSRSQFYSHLHSSPPFTLLSHLFLSHPPCHSILVAHEDQSDREIAKRIFYRRETHRDLTREKDSSSIRFTWNDMMLAYDVGVDLITIWKLCTHAFLFNPS